MELFENNKPPLQPSVFENLQKLNGSYHEMVQDYADAEADSSSQNYGLFPPTGSPTSDKFISSFSIIMLICFFLMLRLSAGPFLHPSGEARIAASSSFYFSLSSFFLVWVTASTIMILVPHFSSHNNNGVIAAALFFPMVFLSLATLLWGRLMVRSILYFLIRSGIYSSEGERNAIINNLNSSKRRNTRKPPKMIAFHRPFRKLGKSCALVSSLLSLLYAHCWSQTLSVFKINKVDGAGAICRAVFSPLASNSYGADERTIWLLWVTIMVVMTMSYGQDEFRGHHCCSNPGIPFQLTGWKNIRRKEVSDDLRLDELVDYSSDDTDESAKLRKPPRNFVRHRREVPQDTLPMVPWLSLFAAHSVLDIFLQMKVFLGRVDARSMQPGFLQEKQQPDQRNMSMRKTDKSKMKDPSVILSHLRQKYPGCVYDYSSRKQTTKDGLWFDFMADCGDGFNSSYQVARMLAQQNISVKHNGKETKLPRGKFLVLGGDLAYPEPTEHSFEKRFFRTFEDAMAPPPSFRRRKIAIDKKNISVEGWDTKKCFDENADDDADAEEEDTHLRYKGPSTFIVPGNHDWYDGLATFTRFILCRDFLGGWLMPQQRSYFAIKLVEGWWILGFDCALAVDIDIEQFKFFADVADNAVGDSDSVIIINHEPHWVTDHDNGKTGDELSERNISELMENHLRGKVRVRLAGDLHHYTRHVPVKMGKKSLSRTRSFSVDRNRSRKNVEKCFNVVEPFTEVNKPDLIVSGGGGAFLHGTNTYDKNIKVGPNEHKYTRVAAFPNEAVSAYLGWFNMYQFRWRGWRCDLIFAFLYLGIVSSLFPLCGVYANYEDFNPEHDVTLLCVWLAKTIGTLIVRVITSERFSLFCLSSFVCLGSVLQSPEHNVKPALRYFLVFCHVLAHIVAALTTLIFVQCMAEWIVKDHIVTLTTEGSLAGHLYGEYKTHFYPVLKNFTHQESTPALETFKNNGVMPSILTMMKAVVEYSRSTLDYLFSHVPLLKATLKIFDLPTLVAQNHHDMCSHLCADGVECLLYHDPMRFQTIKRSIFVPYVAGVILYYIFISVPLAGSIFGTWLAVTSNIFKCQCDLAFSSLQIEHYKNFVKLHIREDGELEIFAIGLRKVPMEWVKDSRFVDHSRSRKRRKPIDPSWSLQFPSQWIAKKPAKKHDPQIIDYTCIPKRRIQYT